jgi:hypothetical protein
MPLRMIRPSLAGRVTPGEPAQELGPLLVASEAGGAIDLAAVMGGADVAGVTMAGAPVRDERVGKMLALIELEL